MGFYHAHHAGRVNRQKIRVRTYVETGSQFLEIKRHQKKGRTVKVRKLMTDSEISPLNCLLDPFFLVLEICRWIFFSSLFWCNTNGSHW
jgi:hypothetical protein